MTLKKVKEPTKRFIKWFNEYSEFVIKKGSLNNEFELIEVHPNFIELNDFKKLSRFYKGETMFNKMKLVLDGKGNVKQYEQVIKWKKIS
jgi:hypothetical protein